MYTISISRRALKDLKKLNSNIKRDILRKIYSIRHNPFSHIKRLQGKKLWRLRTGDYRSIIDVIVKGNKIIVLRIGHRKNIYNKI
ncbi:type II toxin-antitoxin system RelE/ParE family toxin [Candidatus Woesearchaeota archaeon]|jgi:mRNA interferase RelE/StbE|nr:type II toxin-antitoxin system RelE/ParE family toxin [Candidatus Woesearchaeota archaeon]MBT4321587.1 type II toxin-antitoxin system RelE/ParE family toxin [Candidatus Woesearchaeota archaeon]MBT4631102.1 type II toxin-antitoxin system RelE/ParE family toxin [Candidatus Woesearchaeota archaeon]